MHAAKFMVFSVFVVLVSPLVVAAWLEKRLVGGEIAFNFGAQALALLPGLPGTYARGAYYFGTLDRCSWETHVGFGSMFTHRAGSMGRRSSTGCFCVLGHADIGDGVMMGSRVSIPSGKRQHLDGDGRLSATEGKFERVAIGAGCWIGEGAVIMADIGQDSIVSAGSVVTQPMPPASLVAGNPARLVRSLSKSASTGCSSAIPEH